MRAHSSGFSLFKFFLVVLVVGALAWTFFCTKIQTTSLFPIATIKIASDYHRVSKIQLKKVIAHHIQNKNFLTLNIAQLKKNLLKIPWIQDVTIRRVWPDTVLIKLEEQIPIALLNEKAVVNSKGEVFYPHPASIPKDLPHLIAPDLEMDTALQHYHAMTAMIKPLTLQIVFLKWDLGKNCTAILDNGTVLLFRKKDILAYWKRFILAYPKLLQEAMLTQRRVGQIDLRYPNGFAVRWRPHLKISHEKHEKKDG